MWGYSSRPHSSHKTEQDYSGPRSSQQNNLGPQATITVSNNAAGDHPHYRNQLFRAYGPFRYTAVFQKVCSVFHRLRYGVSGPETPLIAPSCRFSGYFCWFPILWTAKAVHCPITPSSTRFILSYFARFSIGSGTTRRAVPSLTLYRYLCLFRICCAGYPIGGLSRLPLLSKLVSVSQRKLGLFFWYLLEK